MRLNIKGIIDRGVPNKERVHIFASQPANLSYYVLMEAQSAGMNQVHSGGHLSYWFGATTVNYGDHVILYTRPGTDNSVRRKDGFMNYFFYWGLNRTIWNNDQTRAVLFELQSWLAD